MVGLSKVVTCLTVVMVSILCTEGSQPVLHKVGGGKFTWGPKINFTEWASHEQFYVGDWLYFGFDKHRYNVLQVNKTSYDRCIDKNFIKNITNGGRDVFNLTEAKPYYFISGRGYCFKGMKLAVYVKDSPPSDAPLMVTDNSSSNTCALTILLMLLASAWVWAFLIKYI